MKSTDYILDCLNGIISSESSLSTLLDMMSDMDLELVGVQQVQ